MSVTIIVNDNIHINVKDKYQLKKYPLFNDFLNEFENVNIIPLKFEHEYVVSNYLNDYDVINDITDPNELIKYMQFGQFIGDNEANINSIAVRIVQKCDITKLKDDLIPEIENVIMKNIPDICGIQYLYYKYKTIRDNIDWEKLSRNRSITLEFIELNINKPWNWGRYGLSANPIITPSFIQKHEDKSWYWGNYGLNTSPFINYYL